MALLNARPADVDIVVVFNPCSGSYIRSLALPQSFRVSRQRGYFALGTGDNTIETAVTTYSFDDVHRSHAEAYASFHEWGYQCGIVAAGPFETVQAFELGEIDAHPSLVPADGGYSLAAERAILTTRRVKAAKLGADASLTDFARWYDALTEEPDSGTPALYRLGEWTVRPRAGGRAPFQTETGLLVSPGTAVALKDIYLPAAGTTVRLEAPVGYGPDATVRLRAERHTSDLIDEVSGAGSVEMTLPAGTFKLRAIITAADGPDTSLEEPRLTIVRVAATSEVVLRRVTACMPGLPTTTVNEAPFWDPACGPDQDVEIILEGNDAPAWESEEDLIRMQFGDNTPPTLSVDDAIRFVRPAETPSGEAPFVWAPPIFTFSSTRTIRYRAIGPNGDPITSFDIEGAAFPRTATLHYYNAGTFDEPTWVRDDPYAVASSDRSIQVTWDLSSGGIDFLTVKATDANGRKGASLTNISAL